MARMSLLLSAAALALVSAQPGMANTTSTGGTAPTSQFVSVYNTTLNYEGISLPVTLTVNTTNGTANYKGNGVDITYQGESLKSFQGGPTPPVGNYPLTSVTGQIDYAGNTYKPFIDTEQDATALNIGANGVSLTTNVVDKDDVYSEVSFDTPLSFLGTTSTTSGGPTSGGTPGGATSGGSTSGASGGIGSTTSGGASGGTTTGGTTTGGASGGTTGGGTEVPAPSAALLFGLGAVALGVMRRRKSAK